MVRSIDNGYNERATEITEDCFLHPAVITVQENKLIKIALDSRKLYEVNNKKESTIAEHGKINIKNFKKAIRRRGRRNLGNEIRFRLGVRTDQFGQRNEKFMHFYRYRQRIHWLLPFREMILRSGGDSNNFSRTDR